MLGAINRRLVLTMLLTSGLGLNGAVAQAQPDTLPSWNDGAAKQTIVGFVERVTREGGADYVKPAERIAAFDNDGTLWAEQPIYTKSLRG